MGLVEEFSTHAPSHSSSVGQTLEQLAPTGLADMIVLAEPFKFPEAIFLMNDGISMLVGQA